MPHSAIAELMLVLGIAGYHVDELADVGSATRVGMTFDVTDPKGRKLVVSVITTRPTEDSEHPGVPASLYMAHKLTDPNV